MAAIVWVGPDSPDGSSTSAQSIAAVRWQASLTTALRASGGVSRVSYSVDSLWPRGGFVQRGRCAESVPYLNGPGWREVSLGLALWRRARSQRVTALVTYNLRPAHLLARAMVPMPWIAVVADGQSSSIERQLAARCVRHAAGVVYLSYYDFCRSEHPRKMHLDGGVWGMRDYCPASEKVFLYAGSLGRYGGVQLLLAAMKRVVQQDVKVWICGKGSEADTRAVLDSTVADSRISYLGVLTDEELADRCAAALAYVNPRPSGLAASSSNFPSKLLEYLPHGKPIISTWTAGLDPSYRQVLHVFDGTEAGLAEALVRVSRLDVAGLVAQRAIVERFCVPGRLWSVQACRLWKFVKEVSAI